MIPTRGGDPDINVVAIGSRILTKLKGNNSNLSELLVMSSVECGVSIDHIILALDWLYAIGAINLEGDKVYIYEAN